MTKSFYNLKTQPNGSYGITKFTSDLEVESTYEVSLSECDCPQGERGKTCRHQRMLPMFIALNRTDTEYFLDFDTKTWHQPLAASYEVEYHSWLIHKLEQQEPAPQGIEVIPKASTSTLPLDAGAGLATKEQAQPVPESVPVSLVAPFKRRRI